MEDISKPLRMTDPQERSGSEVDTGQCPQPEVPAHTALDLAALATELGLPPDLLSISRNVSVDLGRRGLTTISLMCNPTDVTTGRLVASVGQDEYHLLELESLGTTDVLDIGSHGGTVAILLAKLHPHVVVHAFEPSPLNFFYLVWNIHTNGVAGRVLPRRLGLSAAGGRRSFMVSSQDTTGTRMSATVAGASNGELWGETKFQQRAYIDTVRLDTFLENCGVRGMVSFVKLDCEGCEYEIVPPNLEFFTRRVLHLVGELHTTAKTGHLFDRRQVITRQAVCRERLRFLKRMQNESSGVGWWDSLHGCTARALSRESGKHTWSRKKRGLFKRRTARSNSQRQRSTQGT